MGAMQIASLVCNASSRTVQCARYGKLQGAGSLRLTLGYVLVPRQ